MARRHDDTNRNSEETTRFVPSMFLTGGRRGRAQDEKMMVSDRIRQYQNLFEGLERTGDGVEDVNLIVKTASTALQSIQKLCESHKNCRDIFLTLVGEISDILEYNREKLGSILRSDMGVKIAFEAIVDVVKEILVFLREQSKDTTIIKLFRSSISTGYELKLEALRDKIRRAGEDLRDSIDLETSKRNMLDYFIMKFESVLNANYSSIEGCLEDTRTELLTEVDTWIRGHDTEKMMWVYGHAGTGKSALFNSIAKNLENAKIPFICFPCKWDDLNLSNIHRVLSTISYRFASVYDDYRSTIHDVLEDHSTNSASTDVKMQSELLFGKAFNLISPKGSSRPSVHVLLVDALNECRNHRDGDKSVHERRALLEVLLDFSNTVPWVKALVISRPEPDIVNVFKDTTYPICHIDINGEKWRPTPPAMRHFLLITSDKLGLDLSYDQIERFRRKASGFFIWYTTIFKYIRDSKESRKLVIERILKDSSPVSPDASLDPLYQRILDLAIIEAHDKDLMELVLGVILIASTCQPLSAAAIVNMIFPEEQDGGHKGKRKQVDSTIRALSAILCVEEGSKVVRACHSSALEFIVRVLRGSSLVMSSEEMGSVEPFSIGPKEMHARILERCFAIMKRELRFNICDLEDSHRLNKDVLDLSARITHNISGPLRYAILLWASHLAGCNVKEISEQVYAFLNSRTALYWVEALSLMNIVDRGIVILHDCARLLIDHPNVVKMAGEWERFLLAYGDASKSTPHLYLSALSWLPGRSRLWDIVHDSFSSELPLISNAQETWNSEMWSENVRSTAQSVAYSVDGRLVAAGGDDVRVRLWEARSGKAAREAFVTKSWVESIAFSGDNRWLASGHFDGSVRLWDLNADSAKPRVLKGHRRKVNSVSFSSDSKRIICGSGARPVSESKALVSESFSGPDEGSIRVWDVDTAKGVSFTDDYLVNSVTFSADDTYIISGSADNTVRIWDPKTREQIGEPLRGHSSSVYSIACSRDRRFIASGSADKTIILWDAQTYEQIGDPLTGHTGGVNSVCFSADSKLLASGSWDHSVRIWNIETHSLVSVLQGHTGQVHSIAFSPDWQEVLSGSKDGTVRVWDAKGTASTDQSPAGNSPRVTCVSYVPNSCLIASALDDGNIRLWNANTGTAVGQSMQGHTLAVSNTGKWLASGSDDNILRIWDITSGTSLGEPLRGHNAAINSVAVSSDNRLIASASSDRTVRLWDATTRRLLMTLEGHGHYVTSVTFSVDGDRVISGSYDRTIRVWDTRTGDAVGHPLKDHSDWVRAVAVSPDGQWIASASDDRTVRIWSMLTLSEVHRLKHSSWVLSVAFSDDSQLLISGSDGHEVRVWNVETGEVVGNPSTGHAHQIKSISFSHDGLEFVSGSSDGIIRIWDTRARTEGDYAELDEEVLRIRWNASRASTSKDNGWVKDGEKLLLWVPLQYRHDINDGSRLAIGAGGLDTVRPKVDYRKVFRFSGSRWKDTYTGGRLNERMVSVA